MKTSLNKEINNIRNAALSAYLMAFFTNAYYKEAQEFPNLQLLFVVYPLFYVEDILKLIEGTYKPTGLLGCVNKLRDNRKKENDILLHLQIMIEENILSIGNDGKIIPIEKNIKRIRVEGHDVSMMCKSAEKVGIWFAKLPIAEIEQILKVRL